MNRAYNLFFLAGVGAAALMGACATGTDATTDDDNSTRSTTTGGGDGGDAVGGAQAGPAGPGSGGAGNNPGPGVGGSADGGGGAGAHGGSGGAGNNGGMGGIGAGGMGSGGVANGGNGGSGGTPIVCTPILLDPSFEGGSPNATWAEASTNFGTPLCTAAGCMGGAPLSGSWFYWGGGFADVLFGGVEISTVSQTLMIPAGTATLDWRMTMPNCDTGFTVEDYFGIVIDGTVAYVIDTLTEPTCGGTTYSLRSIDVSAYADGGSHTIEIVVDQLFDPFFSTDVTNVFVDDVVLTSCQ